MRSRNIHIAFCILFFPLTLNAGVIDSLLNLVRVTNPDKTPRLLHDIADAYFEQDSLLKAVDYFIMAAEMELQKDEPEYMLVCESYGNTGYIYNILDRYHDALFYGQKCYDYATLAGIPREQSASLVNMGSSWFNLGSYDKSVEMYLRAVEIDKEHNDTLGLSVNYNNLGKVFELWENYTQALEYYLRSLEISQSTNDSVRIAVRLSGAGMAYRGLKDYDNALRYLYEALAIDSVLGSEARIGTRYSNLGIVYHETGEYHRANDYFERAIILFRNAQSMRSLAIVLNQLGNLQFMMDNPDGAIENFKESLEIANETKNLQLSMKNQGDLAMIYELVGDYQKALASIKNYHELNDSIFNQQSLRAIEELKIKNEIEKSETEIVLLRYEREMQDKLLARARIEKISFLIFGFIALVLLLLISRLYYQKTRIATQLQNLNATKDKFFAIISHDLKNPVTAFRNVSGGLVEAMPELSKEEIKTYVAGLQESATNLNDLLQNLLFWARSQTNMFQTKPRKANPAILVNKALISQQTAIGQKELDVRVNVDESIEVVADENIVLTVLRNLLSNAVRYSDRGNTINISVHTNGSNDALFQVSDNGPGISKSDINKLFRIDIDAKTIGSDEVIRKGKGSGLGLILCQELIQKSGGRMWVSSELNKGSTFAFTVPLNGHSG